MSLPIGLELQAKAEATLSDGSVLDVTHDDALSWSSSDSDIAVISSSGEDKGVVTGVAVGDTTIMASLIQTSDRSAVQATTQVVVTDAVVTELSITPADISRPVGLGEPLKAEATLSDGSVLDVTHDDALSWSSSDSGIAVISSSGEDKGVVTGVAVGDTTIMASLIQTPGRSAVQATTQVVITDAVVTELSITPTDISLPAGLGEPLKAEATLSDGSVLDVTHDDALSWSSSDPGIAVISSSGEDKGVVTGVEAGDAIITASLSQTPGRLAISTTAEVVVKVPLVFFTTPDVMIRYWNDADAYCKEQAARLPTRAELQNLFIQSTSATAVGQSNYDMCDVHNWPLFSRCGGSTDTYWTSEANGTGGHWRVGMYNGYAYSTDVTINVHVTCVR